MNINIFIDMIVFMDYKGVKYPNEDAPSWDVCFIFKLKLMPTKKNL